MFTIKDFLSLTDYFIYLSTDEKSYFEVISKNTSHRWKIIKNDKLYSLMHAHNTSDSYHLHGEFYSMLDCVLEIVDHDEWKLNIWRHKHIGKWVQPQTYFDKLIKWYC